MAAERISGSLSAASPSMTIRGDQLAGPNMTAENATLLFSGSGNWSFVLEGRVLADPTYSSWESIGTFTQDDTQNIVTFPYSAGVEYRVRRTAGTVTVSLTG